MSSTGFFSLHNLQWCAENSSFRLGEFQLDKEIILAFQGGNSSILNWRKLACLLPVYFRFLIYNGVHRIPAFAWENSSFCLGEFQLGKEIITAWEFGNEIVPAWK